MFKPYFAQKGEMIKKKVGPGWFKHMIYLPPPFCRKKRFWPKKREFMIYLFWPKKSKGRS